MTRMSGINKIIFFLSVWMLLLVLAPEILAEVYSVHTSSFKTLEQAKTAQNRLVAQGYQSFIMDAEIPGKGRWHRVYAGKYSTRQNALQAAEEMKKKQLIEEFFIRPVSGKKNKPAINSFRPAQKEKGKSVAPVVEKKENIPKVSTRQPDIERDKKEAFKELIMGGRKLMPAPPKLEQTGQTSEESFKEPDEKDIIEPASDSPIYNKALTQLKQKKHSEALATFKEFISQKDTSKEWGQRALRHMADCHYWLGKAGSKQDLYLAVEFYKNTLKSFPDPLKENALTYYRIAKTYEHLRLFSEAARNYKNLIAKYPASPLAPEAYFKIGETCYQDGKYLDAAEALIRFQLRYKGKIKAQKSFYLIAHSFYKAKQFANAEIWFRDARKQWPDLTEMPEDILLDYGLHKASLRRYDEAVEAFSLYVNLYPDDEKTRETMMALADAYLQIGQYAPALAVYSRIIDKYPVTVDAGKSILAMASSGIVSPGLKVFRFFNHIQYYLNPMDTYDALLSQHAAGDISEEAMLQKAAAWARKGEGRKAADIYLDFIRLYPDVKRTVEAARGLKTVSASLIDEYYAKNDYLAVAYIYFKSFGLVELEADENSQVRKIAISLKELGLLDDYGIILNRYLKVAKNEAIADAVRLDIAEGLLIQGKYDEALSLLDFLAAKASVKKGPLLVEVQKNLAEIAYRRRQYDRAAANYGAVIRSGQSFANPGQVYANYARSLMEKNQTTEALQNYLTAVKYLSERQHNVHASITYNEIGDLYISGGNPASSLEMYGKAFKISPVQDLQYWSQFLLGQTYLKLNKDEDAQSKFSQLKTTAGAAGFWGSAVDFYAADSKWWDKYGDMVKK